MSDIFAISDLHLGDGGPRDNSIIHLKELNKFLDYVQDQKGELIICGDLFEFWQSNLSIVLQAQERLLDDLAKMEAVYVLGNHDADLHGFAFPGALRIQHPFFDRMTPFSEQRVIEGNLWKFVHGHDYDSACYSSTPGIARISAIYSGMKEDQNGGPFRNKVTVESLTVGRLEWLLDKWRWLQGKPSRNEEIYSTAIEQELDGPECTLCGPESVDGLVMGHTHEAGQRGNILYNCGTWAEDVCSFVHVNVEGGQVFDWIDGSVKENHNEL